MKRALLFGLALLCGGLVGAQVQPINDPAVVNIITKLPQSSPSTDYTAIVNTQLAAGKIVYFPNTGNCFVISGQLTFALNSGLMAAEGNGVQVCSSVAAGNQNMFSVPSGADHVRISGLVFSTQGARIGNVAAADFRIDDSTFNGGSTLFFNGATAIGGYVTNSKFNNNTSIAIDIENGASANIIKGNEFENEVGFGVRVETAAHDNQILNNWTNANGIELIGLTYNTYNNLVEGNDVKLTGDNCISVTGYNNRVVGNRVDKCRYSGIFAYGSWNSITGNIASDVGQSHNPASPYYNAGDMTNYAGLQANGNFGGTGQDNSFSGNTVFDDQTTVTTDFSLYWGTGYVNWATSTVYAAGAYTYNAGNTYQTVAGGTSGASAPTCTSGTCSDGAVTWTFLIVAAEASGQPVGNYAAGNRLGLGSHGTAYLDATGNNNNTFLGYNTSQSSDFPFETLTSNLVNGGLGRKIPVWVTSTAYTYGQLVRGLSSNNIYRVINVGCTSSASPTVTSGTQTTADSCQWLWLNAGTAYQQLQINQQNTQPGNVLNLTAEDSATNVCPVYAGAGTPSAKVTASVCAIYLRTDGVTDLTVYVKQSGTNTSSGWSPLLSSTSANTLTATGTTQGTALAISTRFNAITTVASGTGAILSGSLPYAQTVVNVGANPLALYPPSGAQINAKGSNAADSIAISTLVTCYMASSTQYYCTSKALD